MTITEFLLARLAEAEDIAWKRPRWAHVHESGCYYYNYDLDAGWHCDCDDDGAAQRHMMADIAAKRAIVEAAEPVHWYDNHGHSGYADAMDVVLRQLAAVYADHPAYRQEWAK